MIGLQKLGWEAQDRKRALEKEKKEEDLEYWRKRIDREIQQGKRRPTDIPSWL